MSLTYELSIISKVHEDASGIAPPPRSILLESGEELIEYVRGTYGYLPHINEMTDQEMLHDMLNGGLKISMMNTMHWDILTVEILNFKKGKS